MVGLCEMIDGGNWVSGDGVVTSMVTGELMGAGKKKHRVHPAVMVHLGNQQFLYFLYYYNSITTFSEGKVQIKCVLVLTSSA